MKTRWTKTRAVVVIGLALVITLGSCAPETVVTTVEVTREVEKEVTTEVEKEVVVTATPMPEEEVEVIKFGAILPLSGTDALNGERNKMAHDVAVEEINAAGGIKSLGGAKIQMVYGDHGGKPEAGIAETERLISEENVLAVFGAYHSHVALPASETAERYGVPFIATTSIASTLVARGLHYMFKTCPGTAEMARDVAYMAREDLGAETGVILVPDIAFGTEVAEPWREAIPEAGIELLGDWTFPSGATDLSDAILKVETADPDVIFTCGNTPDAILLVRQLQELDYWPKGGILTVGGPYGDKSIAESLGVDGSQGLTATWDWWSNINLPGAKEVSQEFEEEAGFPLGYLSDTYATMWVMADILEVSGCTDAECLANALRTTTLEPGDPGISAHWAYAYPEVSFAPNGQLEAASTVLGQWQDGEFLTVWPEDLAVAEMLWPVPGWDER